MAGRITAPASAARFMFSICGSDSGVSRGTRISLRRSLRWTSAARWIRLAVVPWAMAPSVLQEQGQTTMPSVGKRAAGQRREVVLVMVVAEDARLAGAHAQHVARIAGDARLAPQQLQFRVAERFAAVEHEHGGVEVLQIDAQVEFLFEHGSGRRR